MTEQFIVSAFSDVWEGGNPAAVCILDQALDDARLQAIAEQNQLSETAFINRSALVGIEEGLSSPIELRWFTPSCEVDLCGHATLAAAFVLYDCLNHPKDRPMVFQTRSGLLTAHTGADQVVLDLPASLPEPVGAPPTLIEALGGSKPKAMLAAEDYLVVYPKAAEVRALSPDFDALCLLDRRGVIVTAPSDEPLAYDFVSRFFAPKVGVNEDPVTGSAHCQLIPYWSGVLGKDDVSGFQCSSRGGRVSGRWHDPRVCLKGQATLFAKATLFLS